MVLNPFSLFSSFIQRYQLAAISSEPIIHVSSIFHIAINELGTIYIVVSLYLLAV